MVWPEAKMPDETFFIDFRLSLSEPGFCSWPFRRLKSFIEQGLLAIMLVKEFLLLTFLYITCFEIKYLCRKLLPDNDSMVFSTA